MQPKMTASRTSQFRMPEADQMPPFTASAFSQTMVLPIPVPGDRYFFSQAFHSPQSPSLHPTSSSASLAIREVNPSSLLSSSSRQHTPQPLLTPAKSLASVTPNLTEFGAYDQINQAQAQQRLQQLGQLGQQHVPVQQTTQIYHPQAVWTSSQAPPQRGSLQDNPIQFQPQQLENQQHQQQQQNQYQQQYQMYQQSPTLSPYQPLPMHQQRLQQTYLPPFHQPLSPYSNQGVSSSSSSQNPLHFQSLISSTTHTLQPSVHQDKSAQKRALETKTKLLKPGLSASTLEQSWTFIADQSATLSALSKEGVNGVLSDQKFSKTFSIVDDLQAFIHNVCDLSHQTATSETAQGALLPKLTPSVDPPHAPKQTAEKEILSSPSSMNEATANILLQLNSARVRPNFKKSRRNSNEKTTAQQEAFTISFRKRSTSESAQSHFTTLSVLSTLREQRRLHPKDVPETIDVRRRQRKRDCLPRVCAFCQTTETPEWRKGPEGANTLCNACGLQYAKSVRRRSISLLLN